MDWAEILHAVMGMIQAAVAYLWSWIVWVWNNVLVLWDWAVTAFKDVWTGIVWFGRHLWRGITALRHLNFSKIWAKIKAGYKRFSDALDWYRRHVLAPLDRLRRQIWQIYRTFFKPIILFIDSLRVFTRMLAIFNRKLAARLDHYLMGLEGKILSPITALLHRVNAISSYFTALITTTGRLARSLLLESMRRDALLVWEVLTNPRAMLYEKREPRRQPDPAAPGRDFREYIRFGTGPLSETYPEDHAALLQGMEEAK